MVNLTLKQINLSLGTLNFTKELIAEIVQNNTILWNDPRILALNPGFSGFSFPIRMIFERDGSPITTLIQEWLFPNNSTSQNGSWIGLATTQGRILVSGYEAVASALAGQSYTLAFVPHPFAALLFSTTIRISSLIDANQQQISIYDQPELIIQFNGPNLGFELQQSNFTWPMNVISYLSFNQSNVNNTCENVETTLRFNYWVLNNELLNDTTFEHGKISKSKILNI
jgi:ABC-type phosphate transport system substrate-binding protein